MAYIIEPIGFFDKHNKPFHDDGYRYDDYLPGYADAVFTDEAKAKAFIAAYERGEDDYGVIAKFRVSRTPLPSTTLGDLEAESDEGFKNPTGWESVEGGFGTT